MYVHSGDFRQKSLFWWFVRRENNAIYMELTGEKLFPLSKEKGNRHSVRDFLYLFPENRKRQLLKDFFRTIRTRSLFYGETEFRGQPDFALIKIILSAVHDFSGGHYRGSTGVAVFKDPLDSELEHLRNKLELYRIIIDYLPIGVWAKDWTNGGRYCLWNHMTSELSGYPASEVLGRTDKEIFSEEVAEGHMQSDEQSLFIKDDILIPRIFRPAGNPEKEQYNQIVKKAVYNEKGEPVLLLGIASDITDKIIMERDLRQAKEEAEKSSKLKSFFIANMSHEIRTPLNSIVGFSRLLTQPEGVAEEERILYKSIIEKNSDQLLHLIEDIIDLSRIEAHELSLHQEEVSVNLLLSELHAIFRPSFDEKKLELIKVPDPEDSIIIGDDVRLKQIFSSLLSNARKFTEKGNVSFGVYEKKPDKTIEFFVSDTGIGIPEERIEMIFERFRQGDEGYTRKFGGLGMGLTIARKITELFGGSIRVDSVPGKGSSFYFTIPTGFSGRQ